jgi:DNA invertase Pin-like site-specific DNA recombinase
MSHQSSNGKKPLRFANLIRVSTEKQKVQGESLHVQRDSNAQDVERLGGTIVATYGGQEHATPGWEKAEVDRLLADAAEGKFDAVIVNRNDRWSRENAKNEEGLEVFRQHKVRFFVSLMEMNLFDPYTCAILAMNAVFGQLTAAISNLASLKTKIKRAGDGKPSCGKLPYGRTYDKKTEGLTVAQRWGIDKKKQALIRDVAERYLAGESMPKLARELGTHRGNLNKLLRDQCGDTWNIVFRSKRFNIHEPVTVKVPALLDKDTIKAVRAKLKANRTFDHKPANRRYDYLLSGKVFCAGCGYHMFGQTNTVDNNSYYIHCKMNTGERKEPCSVCTQLGGRKPWVPAPRLEELVLVDLFEMFGNPAAIEKAVKAAVPDCDKALIRKAKIEADLAGIDKARNRILGQIEKDTITDAQAEGKLKDLKNRETDLRAELETLVATLKEVPDPETIELFVEQIKKDGRNPFTGKAQANMVEYVPEDYSDADVADALRAAGYAEKDISSMTGSVAFDQLGPEDLVTYMSMSHEDKRKLVQSVFAGCYEADKPAGVYVTMLPKVKGQRSRPFRYELRGRLSLGSLPCSWGSDEREVGTHKPTYKRAPERYRRRRRTRVP